MPASDGLAGSARSILSAWPAPDAEQDALRADYLGHLDAYDNAMLRECRAGHITASSLIVDIDQGRVLLTLHPIVGRWLQTGGHCEPRDRDIVAAAAREANEESGIAGLHIDVEPLRLDRHAVMCRPQAGTPTELHHLDVQFLAIAPAGSQEHRSSESLDLRWWTWSSLPADTDDSVRRLVTAARQRLGR